MAARGEGPVIAVGRDGPLRTPRTPDAPGAPVCAGWRARARSWARGAGPGPFAEEIMIRTVVLGSIDTAEAAQRHADLVIEPEVEAVGMTEFDRIDEIRRGGPARRREPGAAKRRRSGR